MFAYGAERRARAVDLVTGPGNIYVAAAKRLLGASSASTPRPGPTEIAILADDTADAALRRRRPDQPGRARPAGRVPCWSPTRASWPTRSRPSSTSRSPPPSTPSGSRTALAGQQSAHRARRRPRRRALDVVDAYAAEHLEIQTRDAAAVAAPGPQRRRDLRRRRTRRCRSATTAPGPTTCCPPAAAPATRRAVGADVPARHARRRLLARRARRGRRPRRRARPSAEDLPAPRRGRRGPVRERRSRDVSSRPAAARRPARASTPYGAPQLDVPVRLNINENPYPPSPALVADIGAAVADGRRDAQPLPRPRGRRAARRRSPAYLGPRRSTSREQVWAANGSNEVCSSCCRPSAARAARRWASRRRTRCTRTTPATPTPAGSPADRDERLHARRRRARSRLIARARPDVVFLLLARTTRPAPRCRLDAVARGATTRRAGAWSSSTRRTPSSAAPARRARSTLLPAAPRPGRHPHDEQGVRARRRPARLPRRRRRRSSTRCGSSGCPTTCRRVTQAAARAALRARRRAARARSTTLRAERDAHRSTWLRGRGSTVADSRRQLRAVRPLRRPARGLAGAARPRRADPRDGPAGWLRVSIGTAGGDGSVPGRTRRDASTDGGAPHEPHRDASSGTTKESKVLVELDLDGTGRADVVDRRRLLRPHARPRSRRHALVDLDRAAPSGDTHIDAHHTVEDTAIVLGAGAARGARRQGRHPPLRRRARAARRGAGAGRRRRVRPPVLRAHRRARRARRTS